MDTGYPERLGLDRPLILKQFETELNPGNQGKSYYIPMFFQLYPTFRTPTAPTKKNSSFAASPSCDRGIHLDAAADGTGVREPEGACVEATEKQKGIYSTKKMEQFHGYVGSDLTKATCDFTWISEILW